MIKILTLAGGIAGGAALSQYPEFSQQYTQRLAGQVDTLAEIGADFDASALRSGLTRTQALAQMTGTQFLNDRHDDMQRVFTRHVILSENLTALRTASPMARLAMPHRLTDTETFTNTWADYNPAMPLTLSGGIAALAGFLGGWAATGVVLSLLLWPFKRRKTV